MIPLLAAAVMPKKEDIKHKQRNKQTAGAGTPSRHSQEEIGRTGQQEGRERLVRSPVDEEEEEEEEERLGHSDASSSETDRAFQRTSSPVREGFDKIGASSSPASEYFTIPSSDSDTSVSQYAFTTKGMRRARRYKHIRRERARNLVRRRVVRKWYCHAYWKAGVRKIMEKKFPVFPSIVKHILNFL